MNLDLIQIIIILWLIERISIERRRYKLSIQGGKNGYWAIWLLCKKINSDTWTRDGGRKLIDFKRYIIPMSFIKTRSKPF